MQLYNDFKEAGFTDYVTNPNELLTSLWDSGLDVVDIAEKLGNAKEEFDFWDNQFRKGLSPQEAFSDRIHDRTINQIGRQMAKSGLYKN